MMDVMQVQKINALALDLTKQGLAHSHDEAVAMAEQMLARKDYTKLTIQMDGTPTASPERAHSPPQDSQPLNLDQEAIKGILEKNTEYLVKKIKDFQDQLTRLEGQLKEVQRSAVIKEIPARSERPLEPESQQKLRPTTPTSSSPVHPRSGGYSASDVSIEKIFYTGNRKQ